MVEAVGATRDAEPTARSRSRAANRSNLPAGEVIIFYGERIGALRALAARASRSNLRLRVRTTNGQLLLGSTPYAFNQFNDGDYVRRSIAKLRVPRGGRLRGGRADQRSRAPSTPVISFGRNGTRNFGYVLFVLAGGLLLAAILGAGTALVARLERD